MEPKYKKSVRRDALRALIYAIVITLAVAVPPRRWQDSTVADIAAAVVAYFAAPGATVPEFSRRSAGCYCRVRGRGSCRAKALETAQAGPAPASAAPAPPGAGG